jgi:hypothetical protein
MQGDLEPRIHNKSTESKIFGAPSRDFPNGDGPAKRLYPSLSETERHEAFTNLRLYLEVAFAIARGLAHQNRGLTQSDSPPKVSERSSVDLKN